jgi:hypothetical protein
MKEFLLFAPLLLIPLLLLLAHLIALAFQRGGAFIRFLFGVLFVR